MTRDVRDDYLAAYRRSVSTPSGVQQANLSAVLERAAALEAEPAPRARWAAAGLVLKISTVAVLTAGLGYAALRPSTDPVPTVAPEVEPRAEAVPPAPPPTPRSAPPKTPAPRPVEAPAPRPTRAEPQRPTVAAASPADLLRQELALLEAAQRHLDAGRHQAASASLAEHARRFPQGALATERAAWRAIVACAGSSAQPRAAARSFILTHGDTPLAAKVKQACDL